MFYQNHYKLFMRKNLLLTIKNYFFKKSLKNSFLMFNIFPDTNIFFIPEGFLSKLSYKLKKKILRFFLKFILPIINQIWDFLEEHNYNTYLIIYLLYLAIYLCLFFCFLIKKLYLWYSYYILFNGFYDFALKTNAIFYIINPRGFLNYKYMMRKRSSPEEIYLLNEIFIGKIEKKEARLIYSRMREYINLLRIRSEDETYYAEEVGAIDGQLLKAFEMMESLKKFYRTDGYFQSKWMRSQKFKEKYHFYWETCYHVEKLKMERNIFADSFRQIWFPFVTSLISSFNNKNERTLLLNNYLLSNFNFSLNDLIDEKFVTFTVISNLEKAFKDLKFNPTTDDLVLIFNRMQKNILIISDYNDSIFICEVLISNYLLGIDNLLKNYFNTFARISIERYIIDKKKSILIEEQNKIAKHNFKVKYLDPFFEFFNKYAFIIASYLVNVVKFFRKNINNSIKEYPILYKNLKAFRKNYKKAKALQINEIKLLFSTWWDRDL